MRKGYSVPRNFPGIENYKLNRMYSCVIPMSLVLLLWHPYVLVCHPYATRMYSYVVHMSLACTRMSFVCHSYTIRMSLTCTHMSLVCTCIMSTVFQSYILIYHPHVTRMSVAWTRMSVVWTRMWFYHEPSCSIFLLVTIVLFI